MFVAGVPVQVPAWPSGPVQHNLQQTAETLIELTSGCYERLGPAEISDAGVPRDFMVDEEDYMQRRINAWLKGCARAPKTFNPTLVHVMVPLVISGVIKVNYDSSEEHACDQVLQRLNVRLC